ncbi:hypothetical protein AK812_SmicGene32475 [Symbiodinium microadriaticum]|uniref:Uncharacterized protein n=1 Tax=Symbiodinium microadriaticum TaxID=2951 RepID=A0A1Q9CTW6_SYMMI|nr:hypothetical protein AK812_SmicGene32475 [Symbiodinium microadriaticum]CAE7455723.1 unnamed protein product [Symbiodinium microadriaticum]CAE7754457.1 unnamed protein product [Symbiodinium sp. KB8]
MLYSAFVLVAIPFGSRAVQLWELQPADPPDRKGQQLPAPVFRVLPPSHGSPCPPLVVLVHFQGASPVTPRVWLLPPSAAAAWPTQAKPQQRRDSQPSPMLPAATALRGQRSSDRLSCHEEEDLSRHPASQARIPKAPPPSLARLESGTCRPASCIFRRSIDSLIPQPCQPCQPRVHLVPKQPLGWPPPTQGVQRRLSEEPANPCNLLLNPEPLVLRQWVTGQPLVIVDSAQSLPAREIKQGHPSPSPPSPPALIAYLEPASRPRASGRSGRPGQAPGPPGPPTAYAPPSEPRVQLVPKSRLLLQMAKVQSIWLIPDRRLSDLRGSTLSPRSRMLGSRQQESFPAAHDKCVYRKARKGPKSPRSPIGRRARPHSASPARVNGSPAWGALQGRRSSKHGQPGDATPGPGSYDPEPALDMYIPREDRHQEKRAKMGPYKDRYKSLSKAHSKGTSSDQSLEDSSTQSFIWPFNILG